MPIQEQNLVFLKTLVMADVPEGGGAATNTVVSGAMNDIFPDISDLGRAYGEFNLRKLALAVRTASVELFGGAKTIVSTLPTDPALGYTLFAASDHFEQRAAAANRVEAYLYKGPMWRGVLNENHLVGMRAISIVQRVNTPLPTIGQTLCLVQDEGEFGELEQYVRVTQVETTETTFTDSTGDFTRWVVRLDLSAPLRHSFIGHLVNRYDTYDYAGRTRLRSTTVADATRYYASKPLTEQAASGALAVRVASPFAQLVPSARGETPLVNQTLSRQAAIMAPSAAATVSYSLASFPVEPDRSFALDTGFLPGSLSIYFSFYNRTFTDDGAGQLLWNEVVIGTVNAINGTGVYNAQAPTMVADDTSATITYRPAAAVAPQTHTLALDVTAENRRLNWSVTLAPIPAPGVCEVAYLSQGNWYTLVDNGQGQLSGDDPAVGAGTLSFVTGALLVTCGALPDAGSQILITWASRAHFSILAGAADVDLTFVVRHSVAEPIQPGTLTATWLVDSVPQTAAASLLTGVIAGDCTGFVSCPVGDIRLEFTVPPDPGTQIGLDYQRVTLETQTFTGVAASGGIATLALGEAIEPGSLELAWSTESTVAFDHKTFDMTWWYSASRRWMVTDSGSSVRRYNHRASDDGAGSLMGGAGTVNYSTGAVTLPVTPEVSQSTWAHDEGEWISESSSASHAFTSGTIVARYTPAGASETAVSVEVALPPLKVRLAPRLVDQALVVGSVWFEWNGARYADRNGVLYRDIDSETGSGLVAGNVDYLSATVELSDYVSGDGALTVLGLAGQFGNWTAIAAQFRTALSPIAPESLGVVAVTADGEQITGVADADGVIAGDWMRGSVNVEVGTGALEFGELDGATWTPRAVDPASIRYNAVAYSWVPLDAEILGIDPVRLPPDGRVPIYRPGDVVMVIHADSTAPTVPAYDAGYDAYIVDCGRTDLAWVSVTDVNDAAVTSGYTLDRAAGVVAWESLAGLATPVVVRHVIGDLVQVSDVQIDGSLTLAAALNHSYPVGSIVAACLIHGNRYARVSLSFDQASWNGIWQDFQEGGAATGTLNLIDYPITVTNEGCNTDRYALQWLTTTTARLISEKRGQIWSGSYTALGPDIAPINPRTRDENGAGGVPYLTIPAAANGGGFSAGNVVRINTIGAIVDFWIARSIRQSPVPPGDGEDGCEIYTLGNVDRP